MDPLAPARTLRSSARLHEQNKKRAFAELTNAPGRKRDEESNASMQSEAKARFQAATKQIPIKRKSTSTASKNIKKKDSSKNTSMSPKKNEINNNDTNSNNNNDESKIANIINNNYMYELTQAHEVVKAIYDLMDTKPAQAKVPLRVGYTSDDLKNFLENSTLKQIFPSGIVSDTSNAQLLKQLCRIVYELDELQLEQILDLYHLAFLMQQYQRLDTHCQDLRSQLLQAVAELAVMFQREHKEYIGITLCDRLVYGAGKERTQRIIDMHGALVQLINHSDTNRDIAMTVLMATIGKVGLIAQRRTQTDVITHAFDMMKRIDWMQLVVDRREWDMFALLQSFSLIMNTKQNRLFHSNWSNELGCEIHKYFMQIMGMLRHSSNYNNFVMMMERYIAFCLVSSAAAKFEPTEALPDLYRAGNLS